jgi:hypothetical protein
MINTSQLQIGSWVMYNGQPNVIVSIKAPEPTQDRFKDKWVIEINPPDSFFVCLDELEPIPLTTDWLERAGFLETDYRIEKWPVQLTELSDNRGYDFEIYLTRESEHGTKFEMIVRYVHELQLLMAALGLPLTFNK